MIAMIRRTRAGRKLLANRLALAALAVIGVYFLIAGFVILGGISPEFCNQPIGPSEVPGWFAKPSPRDRLTNAEDTLVVIERALDQRPGPDREQRQEEALATVEVDGRRLQPRSVAETEALIDEAYALFDEVDAYGDEIADNPDALAALDEMQQKVESLFPERASRDALLHQLYLMWGTDRQGRSIFVRAIFSIKTAVQIGVITALVSVGVGSLLGALAGYFGGWVDHVVIWLYSTFSSIPNLVLLVVLAYVFSTLPIQVFGKSIDQTLIPVYVAFCSTFWIGPCRVIRGETLKIKELEFVQASLTAGFSSLYTLLKHVLPNTIHLMLINFSLLLIGAIKSEVILSFLGLGVQTGAGASWGIMIRDSRYQVVDNFFWQIGAATTLMFIFVLAFNILSDALQDAFDPKHV